MTRIAIVGWGSLIWDIRPEFSRWHDAWQQNGPMLKLEFSRVSRTRSNALTLVLDWEHGNECKVAYALSKRRHLDDAICDLRCREGTSLSNIGVCSADGERTRAKNAEAFDRIKWWVLNKALGYAIWTDLVSNFEKESLVRRPFSLDAALMHLELLDADGKASAADYSRRAPAFVKTSLWRAVRGQPWFQSFVGGSVSFEGTSE
jgi:hypothetical protein